MLMLTFRTGQIKLVWIQEKCQKHVYVLKSHAPCIAWNLSFFYFVWKLSTEPWATEITLNHCQRERMWTVSKTTCTMAFQSCFNHPYVQLTIVVEVNIIRQRLVLRREVRSFVFQELPFHTIFIFFFLPPVRKATWWKNEHVWERGNCFSVVRPCSLCLFSVCVLHGVGPSKCKIKKKSFSRPSPAILLLFLLLFDL